MSILKGEQEGPGKFLKSLSGGEERLSTELVTVAPDGQAVVIQSQPLPPSTGDREFFFFSVSHFNIYRSSYWLQAQFQHQIKVENLKTVTMAKADMLYKYYIELSWEEHKR